MGPLDIALHYLNYISCGPHSGREDTFFKSFSHDKSMGPIDPQVVASLDPRGLIGMVYVGDH